MGRIPFFNFLIFFTGVVAASMISSCASTKFRVEKVPLTKYLQSNPVFKKSHSGLLVFDTERDAAIFDYNSQKHFTPASNTKLLTYFAATKMMEDSIPALEYCINNDTLFFSGTGDPTLLYQKFEYGKTFNFLSNHQGPLVNIEKSIEDARFGPGWSWDDYPYYFSAEKSSFPIYGNMVYFAKEQSSDVIKVTPGLFEDHLTVVQDPSKSNFSIDREEFKNDFRLTFNSNPFEINDELPFVYSDRLFVKLLSDTLKKNVLKSEKFPACTKGVLYSVPTDSISKHILIESDNFLAEHMLLVISNQLGDTLSTNSAIEYVLENHLSDESNEIKWIDGSGLSRYNQVTPKAMVSVLKKINTAVPQEILFQLLPKSGSTGTLKGSFPELAGKIHAKTGSMRHVYNLSGYLETKSGKIVLFSFMNNNFNVSFSELKLEMERVLAVFVNDY